MSSLVKSLQRIIAVYLSFISDHFRRVFEEEKEEGREEEERG